MKKPSEITLCFHTNGLFIPDSEAGDSSKMVPLKKRFELLLCFSQGAAGYRTEGNQDCE